MKFSNLITLLFFTILLNSCSTKNKIFWVSGIKTECTAGAGKMQCLNIYEGENPDEATWENFYAVIEGYKFEEGVMKKIEVSEEKIANPPADGSTIKYTLVKELEVKMDNRINIKGDWTLVSLNDAPIEKSVQHPNMVINLNQMQLSGFGGCNNYTGKINKLNSKTINFGNIANTSRACIGENKEPEFLKALNAVSTYKFEENKLMFLNEKGDLILSYLKGIKKEPNQKINNSWTAIRINGNPINRMAQTPKMEINLTDKKVSGNDGCNDYTGDIKEVTDDIITFGVVAFTNKMCRKMETAESFKNALNQAVSYKIDESNLIFMDANNKEVLAFLKTD